MSSSLVTAVAPPASAQLANASPLHLQLLLMMGSSAQSPNVMEEAKQVQRLLHMVEPDDAEPMGAVAAAKKKKATKPAGASSAAAADDPSKAWSPQAMTTLAASSNALDTLQLAILHDPALPWHPHLRDAEKALRLYGLAAIKLPSTYACARLAHFYITGEFVPRDESKAAKWLRMGAMKGHALCMYQLGYMVEEGLGVPAIDVKQAADWYRKAADLKYPAAMYNLAMILIEKDGTYPGIDQDVYVAIRLMEDAAALGESRAQLRLGQFCFMGNAELDIEASIPRCIQYFTMCLAFGTRVRLSTGEDIPVEKITQGTRLVGQYGEPVTVASTKIGRAATMYQIDYVAGGGHSVTPDHLITLRFGRNPLVTVDQDTRRAFLRLAYLDRDTLRWAEHRRWRVADLPPAIHGHLEEFALYWLEHQEQAGRVRVVRSGELFEVPAKEFASLQPMVRDSVTLPMVHTASQKFVSDPSPFSDATVVAAHMQPSLEAADPSDLILSEFDAAELPSTNADQDALVHAFMVDKGLLVAESTASAPVAVWETTTEASRQQQYVVEASGVNSIAYRVVEPSDQLPHHPEESQMASGEASPRSLSIRHLEQAWLDLGIRAPSAQILLADDAQTTASMVDAVRALRTRGTADRVVVVFGADAKQRWLQEWRQLAAGTLHICTQSGDVRLHLTLDDGSRATVLFAPHPNASWQYDRLLATIARAHGKSLEKVDTLAVGGLAYQRGVACVHPVSGDLFMSLQVSSSDRRFVLADGVLTHNSVHNENDPSVEAAIILGIIYSTQETNSYENEHYDLEKSIRYLRIAADSGHADSKVLLQRQLAKQAKVQKTMVMDQSSEHLKAMAKLTGTLEDPTFVKKPTPAAAAASSSSSSSAKEADSHSSGSLSSTPSVDSLYLALARLHARYPEFGATRLHGALKGEYPHWAVSEKRVKAVMAKEGWKAIELAQAAQIVDAAAAAATTPVPAIVLADQMGKMRINEKAVVNDLD